VHLGATCAGACDSKRGNCEEPARYSSDPHGDSQAHDADGRVMRLKRLGGSSSPDEPPLSFVASRPRSGRPRRRSFSSYCCAD
jgi:hypothetical protein